MRQHPFIVLEGLSGTGKTTLARELATTLEGVYYRTPPAPFAALRDAVDEHFGPASRYLFYLAGLVRAAEEITALLRRTAVVCDRYLATTHCWHAVIGAPVLDDYANLELPIPDLTILITCAEGERQRRLQRRGLTINDRAEAAPGREEALLAGYRGLAPMEIDNTAPKPAHALTEILELLALREPDSTGHRRGASDRLPNTHAHGLPRVAQIAAAPADQRPSRPAAVA